MVILVQLLRFRTGITFFFGSTAFWYRFPKISSFYYDVTIFFKFFLLSKSQVTVIQKEWRKKLQHYSTGVWKETRVSKNMIILSWVYPDYNELSWVRRRFVMSWIWVQGIVVVKLNQGRGQSIKLNSKNLSTTPKTQVWSWCITVYVLYTFFM